MIDDSKIALEKELSILRDEYESSMIGAQNRITDLENELSLLKKYLQPIIQYTSGNYDEWVRQGGTATLEEAQEFLRNYLG